MHRRVDDAVASGSQAAHDDLHLLFECDRPLAGSDRYCLDEIDQVIIGQGRERSPERTRIDGVRTLRLRVPDTHLASAHARLRRLSGGWGLETALNPGQQPPAPHAAFTDGSTFELGHTHFLLRSRVLAPGMPSAHAAGSGVASEPALASLSHECQALFAAVTQATESAVPVLLMGEAGSGKDTLALALHAASGRRGEFVRVECGAFAHEHGSRSADGVLAALAGHCKRANGGTLFLNEIEGLDPSAQLALLGILKAGPRPGGATVISSMRTNHDLRPEVPRIRADLLAELAGFTLRVKPVRDRREDLGTLLSRILRTLTDRAPISSMDPRMGQALLLYNWPYNIAEFESCVRTAVALSQNGQLQWAPATLFHRSASEAPERPEPAGERRAAKPGVVPAPPAEADPEFAHGVRRALRCNLSLSGLQKSELLTAQMVLDATGGSPAPTLAVPALRQIILGAVEALHASSPRGEKQSMVLKLTFIKPAPTQQEAADRLAMAFGTYRRYVTSAVAELTALLWFNELSARARRAGQASAPAELDPGPALLRLG